MTGDIRSYLTGTLGLAILLTVSALLTISRARLVADGAAHARLSRLTAVAIAVQAIHFLEELGTGFYVRFPAVLGLGSWSATFFVVFNLAWILVLAHQLLRLTEPREN